MRLVWRLSIKGKCKKEPVWLQWYQQWRSNRGCWHTLACLLHFYPGRQVLDICSVWFIYDHFLQKCGMSFTLCWWGAWKRWVGKWLEMVQIILLFVVYLCHIISILLYRIIISIILYNIKITIAILHIQIHSTLSFLLNDTTCVVDQILERISSYRHHDWPRYSLVLLCLFQSPPKFALLSLLSLMALVTLLSLLAILSLVNPFVLSIPCHPSVPSGHPYPFWSFWPFCVILAHRISLHGNLWNSWVNF